MSATKSIFQKIGDDAVQARTQKKWNQWFRILDRYDLKRKGHTLAAKHFREEYGLSDWWAQAVTIRYEWEKGLRSQPSKK